MCLDKLTKIYEKPLEKEEGGYRFFSKNTRKEVSSLFQGNHNPFPQGEWIKSDDYHTADAIYEGGFPKGEYRLGFHFFKNKKEAMSTSLSQEFALGKVRVRNITARGKDWGAKAGVALEMKIEKIF